MFRALIGALFLTFAAQQAAADINCGNEHARYESATAKLWVVRSGFTEAEYLPGALLPGAVYEVYHGHREDGHDGLGLVHGPGRSSMFASSKPADLPRPVEWDGGNDALPSGFYVRSNDGTTVLHAFEFVRCEDAPVDRAWLEALQARRDVGTEPDRWVIYRNERYGTSIEYPLALFHPLPLPDNNDGRSFETADGSATFLVYGSHNVLGQNLPDLIADAITAGEFEQVTVHQEGDGYSLLGHRDEETLHRRVLLENDGTILHTFEMSYPAAEAERFEPIAEQISQSLTRASTTNESHAQCHSWDATYRQHLSESHSVTVDFMPSRGSEPADVVFLGWQDGEVIWQHIGTYWCYQGSGGCVLTLTAKDGQSPFAERHIVFADSRHREQQADDPNEILVIGGLYQDFWYGSNVGAIQMDIGSAPTLMGSVFHFDACRDERGWPTSADTPAVEAQPEAHAPAPEVDGRGRPYRRIEVRPNPD